MAITYDTSANGIAPGATSLTYSHTVTGSNPILFVGVFTATTADTVTGVTYNGVAMTRINTRANATSRAYLYVLPGCATGANNIVVTVSGAITIQGISLSYTGASQTGQPDSNATNQVTSNSTLTTSTTVVASNCWLVSFMSLEVAGGAAAGTGTTLRASQAANSSMGDSNGTVGTGSQSMQWNSNPGENLVVVMASFSPATAPAVNSSFLAFM